MSASDTSDIRRHMERLAAAGVDVVRVVYPDLTGTDRAREVLLDHLPSACEHGLAFCRAVYHTTPQGDVVPVAGGLDAGLPDVTVRPDLSTLAVLPWEPGVAACLGEVTDPAHARHAGRTDADDPGSRREVGRRTPAHVPTMASKRAPAHRPRRATGGNPRGRRSERAAGHHGGRW